MSRTHLVVLASALFVAACEGGPTQLASSAAPQFSQSTTRSTQQVKQTLAGTITNDCTGEVITYSGSEHGVISTTTSADQQTVHVHINLDDFHGVSDTGAKYVVQLIAKESQDQDFVAPFPSSTTIHERLKLVSQGPGDNETIVLDETDTFDGTTFTSTFSQSNTCHG
jgi:hypothetical protein